MDRRQRKTREAIFRAFGELLSKKDVSQITVGEIIQLADVGRATFYAHFPTKDFLLKELCEELFCHVLDATQNVCSHRHIFECETQGSVFLHLFRHMQKNDNHVLELLTCGSNDLFLRYFKDGLVALIQKQTDAFEISRPVDVPQSFWVNHVASAFVQAVCWWSENEMTCTAEEINEYFLRSLFLVK